MAAAMAMTWSGAGRGMSRLRKTPPRMAIMNAGTTRRCITVWKEECNGVMAADVIEARLEEE